ncbi:hypothetical protein [Methanofollis ethanolicus]|uniref:hypothetical protein n=1 Tax=Methanofollis ethanolicus TaxID=488124 RepID=UPI00128F8CEF|nr:hypothetical protein [Methanofollis ethanolicus]
MTTHRDCIVSTRCLAHCATPAFHHPTTIPRLKCNGLVLAHDSKDELVQEFIWLAIFSWHGAHLWITFSRFTDPFTSRDLPPRHHAQMCGLLREKWKKTRPNAAYGSGTVAVKARADTVQGNTPGGEGHSDLIRDRIKSEAPLNNFQRHKGI